MTLVGNPIATKDICKLTVLAYLPKLQFLDYTRVTERDITDAKERHSDQLNQLKQSDDVEAISIAKEQREKEHQSMLNESFLIKVSDLHMTLFKKDNDHQKIRSINEVAEPFMKFTDDIKKAVSEFIKTIHALYLLIKEEETQFSEAYEFIIETNRLNQVKIVKDLERRRRNLLLELNTEEEQTTDDQNQPISEFGQYLEETNDLFLSNEFSLVDQVAEMIHLYETELDDRFNNLNDKIVMFFSTLRNLENDYNDKIMEICLKLWEKFNQGEAVEFSDEIRSILVDKDSLLSTITQSHEHRSTKLYKRQEDITSQYKQKIESLVGGAKQTDLERNRKRISDINKLITNIQHEINNIGDDYLDINE